MYLNRVYFGAGAYGIEAAARRYFDRQASELTLPQAAMLAGLLPAPSRYAPNRNPEAARQRASLVLDGHAGRGLHHRRGGDAGARQSRPGGLAAHEPQRELRRRLGDGRPALPPRHDRRGRGGRDDARPAPPGSGRAGRWSRRSTSRARNTASARAPWWRSTGPARCAPWSAGAPMRRASSTAPSMRSRQPGSAFKPFVYLTALERGLRPDTVRIDEPVTFGNWSPHNSSDRYRGPVTLKKALGALHQHRRGAARLRGRAGGRGADRQAHGHQLAARAQSLDRARHLGGDAARAHRRLRAVRQRRLRRDAVRHQAHPHARGQRALRAQRLGARPGGEHRERRA